jgi:hypothetical protein
MKDIPVEGKKSKPPWTKEDEQLYPPWVGGDVRQSVYNIDSQLYEMGVTDLEPSDDLFDYVKRIMGKDEGIHQAVWDCIEYAIKDYYETNPSKGR